MKKSIIISGLLAIGFISRAQVARTSLYEEFTGENCAPCASTNPGLNSLLASQAAKVIPIKWQVPIPSAPSATWSLYKTNQAEIDWRYKPVASGGYGYPQTLSTPTAGYINSAPNGRMDGQEMNAFGLASNHPGYLTAAAISSAQAQTTPFSITMDAVWDAPYTNAVVSVTIQSASSFTASGSLMYRLVLVERTINYASAPGSNGEKDFYDAVRKSYPVATSGTMVTNIGTALPSVWTTGQSQTFTIACAAPSYIVNKYEQAFVGFIQDDGNKKIWQAGRTAKPSVPNDIALNSVALNVVCVNSFTPSLNVTNQGSVAITSMTMIPKLDGITQTTYVWNGNIAGNTSANIALNSYTSTPGSHTFSVNISGVSGGDLITNNNSNSAAFGIFGNTVTSPVTEPFTVATFPPANWILVNNSQGTITFTRSATVGQGGAGSVMYDYYNNGFFGDVDELYLPALNLNGITSPVLTFDHAYSGYPTGVGSAIYSDQLEVKVSTDCGATWNTVFSKLGSALQTAPSTTTAFSPSAAQWQNNIASLPTAANQSQVLVKFVATNDYGNILYLDNVNLSQATSIRNLSNSMASFDLYPNPANNAVTLRVFSPAEQKANVQMFNTLGQMMHNLPVTMLTGVNEIALNINDLPSGIYNVVLNSSEGQQVKKLTVSK